MDIIYPEDNKSEKNKETTLFHSNIRRLYKLIDKSSCLLWNHNNHITIGKKKQFDAEENFFNIETTQLGYGEISITSMTQLFNFMMNIDTFLSQEDDTLVETYNLTKDSYFLDIGSGFGELNSVLIFILVFLMEEMIYRKKLLVEKIRIKKFIKRKRKERKKGKILLIILIKKIYIKNTKI